MSSIEDHPGGRRSPGLFAVAVAAGLAGVIAASRSPVVRSLLNRWTRRLRAGTRQEQSHVRRQVLREAILGKHKSTVAQVFGPPRIAAFQQPPVVQGASATLAPPPFWQADVWYYPIDLKERVAMAIQFHEDRARDVQFVEAM